MKLIKVTISLIALITLNNCASNYKLIEPRMLNYVSKNEVNDVKLEYKYSLLDKKYAKNELKKGVKLVSVKITNNSDKSLIFGRDAKLIFENGSEIYVMENEKVFKTLRQNPFSYLWYLLLTPVNLYTYEANSNGFQETTSSTPIGLVLGPGLTAGNIITASSANNKFKTEMLEYSINGETIKKGETIYGLIGIKTNTFDSLKLIIE